LSSNFRAADNFAYTQSIKIKKIIISTFH